MKTFSKNFEEITGSILLVAVALITLFNVLSRYLLSNPLSWAEEVATYLFIWMAMIGAALAVKTGQHFRIEFLVDYLPRKPRALMRIGVAALVVLASGIIFFYGLVYMNWGWQAVTPATEIPRAIPYGAVGAGGMLMLIRSAGLLFKEIAALKQGGMQ